MQRCAGSQFDHAVVAALCAVLESPAGGEPDAPARAERTSRERDGAGAPLRRAAGFGS